MSPEPATTILRPDEKPWRPLPLAEGAFVKVLKVEPARNHVVFQFRFAFDVETFRLVEAGEIGAALERVGAV